MYVYNKNQYAILRILIRDLVYDECIAKVSIEYENEINTLKLVALA